ncbi:MAG: cbb3-type cytochrome c oxidase subunit I, partial [Segetibacter sp.]
VPLMIGGTIKGLMWQDGKAFIDSVSMMAPYWLWRAIGGTLMWLSHLVFAFNMYKMIAPRSVMNIQEAALKNLEQEDAEVVDVQ